MRVVKCDFFVGDRYSGDWRSIHYANETIYFDLNSETDRRLASEILARNNISRQSGTEIREDYRKLAPCCLRCGITPVLFSSGEYIYGDVCPLCGAKTRPLPEFMRKDYQREE